MDNPVLFADESGIGERFIVFGGVFVPEETVPSAERVLDDFCFANGFGTREVSWKNCSKGETPRYATFAALLWTLAKDQGAGFRALVVDTDQYPLRHEASGASTSEIGFYKFYHLFITRSVRAVAPNAQRIRLVVADLSDQYKHRSEVLSKTVAGKLRELLPHSFQVVDLVRTAPKASRVHQLADVLTGAVSYRLNQRSSHKEHIIDFSEPPNFGDYDPTSHHTPNDSSLEVSGPDETWVGGVHDTVLQFFHTRVTARRWLHSSSVFLAVHWLVVLPAAIWMSYRMVGLLPMPLRATHPVFTAGLYLYCFYLAFVAVRLIQLFARRAWPYIELAGERETVARVILASLGLGLLGAIIYDVLKQLFW